jgi:hypothetical protein
VLFLGLVPYGFALTGGAENGCDRLGENGGFDMAGADGWACDTRIGIGMVTGAGCVFEGFPLILVALVNVAEPCG